MHTEEIFKPKSKKNHRKIFGRPCARNNILLEVLKNGSHGALLSNLPPNEEKVY